MIKTEIRETLFPIVLTSILFLSAIYIPLWGTLCGIFTPIPLIFVYLKRGKREGLLALFIVASALLLFVGIHAGVMFFVEYGVVAIVIAETVRRSYSIERIVLFSTLISLIAVGIIIILTYISKGTNPIIFFIKEIGDNIEQTAKFGQDMGFSGREIEMARSDSKKFTEIFIHILPGIVIIGLAFNTLVNYLVARHLWIKYEGEGYFTDSGVLTEWRAPEYFIWLLIGSGIVSLIPVEIIRYIGLNILIILLFLYFLHGLAIIQFYFIKKNISLSLRVPGYIFILLFMPIVVIGLGVFDLWIDFRGRIK
ncbi:MAG: DUF2232 domain-containing protein [Nitrospinota bacterium]